MLRCSVWAFHVCSVPQGVVDWKNVNCMGWAIVVDVFQLLQCSCFLFVNKKFFSLQQQTLLYAPFHCYIAIFCLCILTMYCWATHARVYEFFPLFIAKSTCLGIIVQNLLEIYRIYAAKLRNSPILRALSHVQPNLNHITMIIIIIIWTFER